MTEIPKRILIIRFSSVGDIVLTLPVYRALRQAFPSAKLVALTKESFADILRTHPDVHDVMTLKPDESLSSIIARVRDQHFDVVIDLHSNLRSRIIRFLAGAKRVVSYQKAVIARRIFVRWRWRSRSLAQHTLDRYLETL